MKGRRWCCGGLRSMGRRRDEGFSDDKVFEE